MSISPLSEVNLKIHLWIFWTNGLDHLNDEEQKGENDRGDDEKKDNERDELSHKGGKSHVHGAQPE